MSSQWSLDDIVRRHPALNHLSETLGRENFIQCKIEAEIWELADLPGLANSEGPVGRWP